MPIALGLLLVALPSAAQTLVTNPAPFLTTNLVNGPRSERLNVVVLGDGYTASQAALFQTHVTNVVLNHLFTVEPFRSYRAYHNVFSITAASLQSGADHPSISATRDTYFDATYDTSGIARLLTLKLGSRVSSLLAQFVPDYDYVVVIVNDITYGGSGGTYAITSIASSAPQIAVHELGHSFGQLADEYETVTPGYVQSERINCTAVTNRANIKWAPWIEASTPVPTPYSSTWNGYAGLFLGCMYTNAVWHRPHYDSAMRTLGKPMGQINGDQIIKRFYKPQGGSDHIDPFRTFCPAGTNLVVNGLQPLPFNVKPMQPDFHSLAVTWSLDGVPQPGQTATNWSADPAALGLGSHTVACTVTDPTTQVRIHTNSYFPTDPMAKTVQWNVDVQSLDPPSVSITNPVNGAVLPLSSNLSVVAVASASRGIAKVEFFADGAKFAEAAAPPYVAAWNPAACGDHTLMARAIATLGETNTSAPVAITLTQDPWQAWRTECFTTDQLAAPEISGETADPDADGIANLFEYAFHLNPTVEESAALPPVRVVDGRLTLTYTKVKNASDLLYTVEVASSLSGPWCSGPDYVTEELLSEDAETQSIRASDRIGIASARTRFMRILITRP